MSIYYYFYYLPFYFLPRLSKPCHTVLPIELSRFPIIDDIFNSNMQPSILLPCRTGLARSNTQYDGCFIEGTARSQRWRRVGRAMFPRVTI